MHDFNRRDFLRGSTIAAAGSTFGLMVPAYAAPEATLPGVKNCLLKKTTT